MRIIFMGTPDFAVPCLDALIDAGHEVVGVFTQPDKPVGRKQVMTPPQVKICAEKHGIPVFQPEKIRNSNALEVIEKLKPEVIVVVAYGQILPRSILDSAPYGCINVHASLLPQYRGSAPIQWAVLNGDKESGVCIMQMDEGIDTGDILLVEKCAIDENETSAELFDRLSGIGAGALVRALDLLAEGRLTPVKQGEGDYQYASMIDKSMCNIDWSRAAEQIHNQVRGLQTWPVAITTYGGRAIKIHKTIKTDIMSSGAGRVVDNKGRLVVCCGDGKCLEILELQPEGKKRMDAKSFLAGNKIEINSKLGD